mmetsp:Transcript_12839/g.29878  ORF Transcript_12839/g.29878 Transcript_12839/m.29878 type:complete len:102 (-) Transcript_12839:86-391(-)
MHAKEEQNDTRQTGSDEKQTTTNNNARRCVFFLSFSSRPMSQMKNNQWKKKKGDGVYAQFLECLGCVFHGIMNFHLEGHFAMACCGYLLAVLLRRKNIPSL